MSRYGCLLRKLRLGVIQLTNFLCGTQCDVKFNADGYTLSASENYEAGDEVYMSYGDHPNDFLLAECKSNYSFTSPEPLNMA